MASHYFHRLRELILTHTEKMVDEYFKGEIKVDEMGYVMAKAIVVQRVRYRYLAC